MKIDDQQKLLKASPGQETLIDTVYDASRSLAQTM